VSSKGRRRRPSSKTLTQVLKCEDEVFLDFLGRCLRWDPDRRLRPDEAVRHEFITGKKSTAAPTTRTRTDSPVKRTNTVSSTSVGVNTNRPLPEPPATSFKNGTAVRSSPVKNNPPIVSRRVSTVGSTGIGSGSGTGSKRTSTGAIIGATAGSGLPRVTTRSVSKEMASAGASAAMSRR